jgi:hypothetical protein
MTLYDKIKAYLEAKDKNFDEGLDYFLKASNHRSLMLYLQRKRNPEKLEYELNKLLKNLPARLQKITLPDVIMPINSNDKGGDSGQDGANNNGADSEDNKGSDSSENTGSETQDESGSTLQDQPVEPAKGDHQENDDHKIIEFRKVNPEDLPEEMRPLYDEIAQKHKEMRSIHEKMKLAQSDEARAEFRQQLVECDDFVSSGWKQIDDFMLLKLQPENDEAKKEEIPAGEQKEAASDIAKDISAARTYLSRNIVEFKKAEEKDKPKLKKKIEKRVNILIVNKASVSKKTRKALVEMAIISKNSELLAE